MVLDQEAYVTIAFGLIILAFVLYIFKYYRKEPDWDKVPEVFQEPKEPKGQEEPEVEEEPEEPEEEEEVPEVEEPLPDELGEGDGAESTLDGKTKSPARSSTPGESKELGGGRKGEEEDDEEEELDDLY